MPWKAFFTSAGDRADADYATNGLEFATRQEAVDYGHALWARWTGARSFGVAEVTDGDFSRRPASELEVIV